MELLSMFQSLTGAEIGDYLIIIAFVLVALFLVGHFMDAGPSKWLAILGILVGGGLALSWTKRRHRYTDKKLREHNEAIARLRKTVEERNAIIEDNNRKLGELQREREALRRDANADKEKVKTLDGQIASQLEVHRKLSAEIDAKEADLMADLAKARTGPELPDAGEIFRRAGVVGARPTTVLPVVDPRPIAVSAGKVSVDGFTLKGDL